MFREYPYLSLQDLNLDYILRKIREMQTELNNFVVTNAIKYADPIDWNITRQYEKNTVVIDVNSGIAYLSVNPVTSGVAITNTVYWTVIFDLSMFIDKNAKNLTDHVEGQTNTATFNSNVGAWLIWYDELYSVISPINVGDAYVINGNIERITIESVIKSIMTDITNISNDIVTIQGDILNIESSTNLLLNERGNGDTYMPAIKAQKVAYTTTLSGDANYSSMQGCAYNSNTNRLLIAIIHDDTDGMLIEVDTDFITVIRRKTFTAGELRHANDITYNPNSNKYYIAGYTEILANESNCLIEIDAGTLDYIRTIDLDPASTDGNYVAGKVCYDSENDIYYTYGNKQINKYDGNFALLETIDMEFPDLLPQAYSILGRAIYVCQAMEYYEGKLCFLIDYDINRNASVIAITNTDGSIFGSIPLYGTTQTEPEGLFVKDELLHTMFGNLQYVVMALVPQTIGRLPVGSSPIMVAKTLPDGTDLDELLELGYYTCLSGTSAATINGSPTIMSYQLFVGCLGANTIQIVYNNFTIALRVIAYNGVITPWRYVYGNPVSIERSINNFFVDGVLSDSMTAIYATIPTGYVRNATIGTFTAWIRGNAGFVSDGVYAQGMQSTNCTATIVAFNDHGITVKFTRNDNQAFTNGTNNTPVTLQFAPFNYTEV